MSDLGPVTYRFGEFEVDVAAYELRRSGHRIRSARQPMDLLLLLLERRQELVSREDIAKRLWGPDVFTDLDAGIRTAILKIRQVLGDSRESPRFVETVPGKGYRFVAPVEVVHRTLRRRRPILRSRRLCTTARVVTTCRPSSRASSDVGRSCSSCPRLLDVIAAAVADGRRRRRKDAAGAAARVRPRERIPRRRLAGRSGAALGARSGGADDRDRPRRPRGPAAIGPRRAARRVCAIVQLLLVLDNCEHLIAACAELVEALLRGAPALRIARDEP